MVALNIPITLIKVSEMHRDLGEVIKSSNLSFIKSPVGSPLNGKYACLKEDKYIVVASKNLKGVNLDYGYNFILTVTSYSNEQNEKIANDFQDETGIGLKKAPKFLEERMNNIDGYRKQPFK